ncbi:hypothetical protein T07_5062 [Trichinella nelsoni]|uniref:Uncharacterized protein n=1 Tax=Trichinella nelsoni TaxID=6336 RepID=A0A0V0S1Y2_9BILA|nr:hypothetical protein T07_5062 [Trichinella nelsoni]
MAIFDCMPVEVTVATELKSNKEGVTHLIYTVAEEWLCGVRFRSAVLTTRVIITYLPVLYLSSRIYDYRLFFTFWSEITALYESVVVVGVSVVGSDQLFQLTGFSSLPSVVVASIIYHIAVSWTAAGDEQPHCCEQRQYPSY